MSVGEVREPLRSWSANGLRAGVATLVRVRRSAPRRPGARFAVSEAGDVAGSVSSGCVEGDLHEHLQAVLREGAPRLLEYGITDEMAADVGLACGGEIEVLATPWATGDPAWEALEGALDETAPAVLLTGLSEPIRGRQLLLLPGGERRGGLGDAGLEERAAAEATPLFEARRAEVLRLEGPFEGLGVEPGRSLELFAESYLPPPRLAIVGATPVAAALCRLAAFLGWSVSVVDPRQAFASADRFPEADRVLVTWPEEGLREVGLDRYLDVVVLAHDRKLDVPALEAALRAGCRYVGQIGGRRTQRLRREALLEAGLAEAELERIRGPVGLDIGAETPEEIALSIAAELVATRRGA